jgi:2-alkyl-3-oxoalkanoate reductase
VAKLEPGSAIAGKAYFIANGEPMSIESFLNALLRAGGFPPEKRRINSISARALATAARAGADSTSPLINPYLLDLFSRASWFNLAAARRDLGYSPKLSTAEGMSRLFAALTRLRMQTRTT